MLGFGGRCWFASSTKRRFSLSEVNDGNHRSAQPASWHRQSTPGPFETDARVFATAPLPPRPDCDYVAHAISISGQRNPGSSAPCDTTHAHVCVQYPRLISACCLMPLLPCILYLSSATALLTIPRPRRHALTAQILVGQSLDGRQLRRPLHLPPQINEPTRRRTRQQARAWKLTMSRLRGDWGGPITS